MDLVVVRTFSHPHEAQLASSALRAAGIEATVTDHNLVGAMWLYSNAIGGVKVLVRPEDVDAAREILDSTAVVHTNDQPEFNAGNGSRCPQCGGDNVAPVTRGKRLAVLSWLLMNVPLFPVKHEMRCQSCGYLMKQ